MAAVEPDSLLGGWVVVGGRNIADSVSRAYDLEGMDVGVIAAGRIGQAVLRRLAPFGVRLHYFDTHRLPPEVEEELGLTFHPTRDPWPGRLTSSPSMLRCTRRHTTCSTPT